MITRFCIFNPLKETLSGNFDEFFCFLADFSHCVGSRRIGMKPFVNDSGIQADDVALLQNPLLTRNSVYHFVVHGDTDRSRIAVIVFKRRNAPVASDNLFSQPVDIHGRYPRPHCFRQFLMSDGENSSRLPHKIYLSCGFNRN